MRRLLLSALLLATLFNAAAQVLPIAEAKVKPEGTTVTIRGIVTNGSEFGTSLRYFQDPTGGMAAFSSTLSGLQRGDSVEITGVLDLYNNLMEINPVNGFSVISSGNPLPEPKVLTMSQGYVEAYEGQLVRFNNTTFISTGNFQTASANYDATDGTLVSAEVRINSASNIAGTPIPNDPIDLVGIMSQYQSTYQLLPRDLNDFVVQGNPPVFTTTLLQHHITTTSFEVSFNTQNPGNTILRYGPTATLGNEVVDASLTTSHNLAIAGLSPASLYYVQAATIGSSGDTSFSAVTPMMTQSLSSGTITCYFTRPVDNTVAQGVNALSLPQLMDDTLIAYMNRAKYTLDIAIYNMDNNNGIVDAINAAYNRGVVVRIIGDGDNMDDNAWGQLNVGNGNKKLSPTTEQYGIMHNKFVIIDANSTDPNDAVLWTGSLNFTNQQVNSDANNVMIFRDQSLARAYQIEFDEMWGGLFGPDKINNTPREFNIGGSRVELYFSPSDDTETAIKNTINAAQHDIEFALFAYTRFGISFEIDDLMNLGVWGGGVVDDTANGSFAFSVLADNGTGTFFVANHSYLVHHKYVLVDANGPDLDPVVLTGSHNWSSSAQFSNDENTVVVHNASVANQYYQEWVARYKDEGGTQLPAYVVGVGDAGRHSLALSVYPNPVTDVLHFSMEDPAPVAVHIMDMSGRAILEAVVHSHSALDVSTLSNGLYLMKVTQAGRSGLVKIVVSR
jgi:hypothetical protein